MLGIEIGQFGVFSYGSADEDGSGGSTATVRRDAGAADESVSRDGRIGLRSRLARFNTFLGGDQGSQVSAQVRIDLGT
jgi:hypothetical protein